MPIEIKEIVIKASVDKDHEQNEYDQISKEGMNSLKNEILKDCKQMIYAIFEEQHSR